MPLTGVRKSQPEHSFSEGNSRSTGIEGVFCQKWLLKKSKGQGSNISNYLFNQTVLMISVISAKERGNTRFYEEPGRFTKLKAGSVRAAFPLGRHTEI